MQAATAAAEPLGGHSLGREVLLDAFVQHDACRFDCDLARLLECPDLLKTLSSGTGGQKKKTELIMKLYGETGEFLDTLPGPPLERA